ncbi:hypothetical protein K2X92_03005, partial [Candidatus Gracilibacteria bacterium]|nr:hypothetical protein [Candidatus Gracilibacteria bacterium]
DNTVEVSIKKKGNIAPTQLDKKVSTALYKADKMSEAAKYVSGGVLTDWNDDYGKEVVLSPENKELRNQLNGIIRHWISDETVNSNILAIRKLIASTIDATSVDATSVLDELKRITGCLLRLNLTSSAISPELIGAIQSQIDVIRTQVNS